MAENCKREQIIEAIVAQLEELRAEGVVNTVARVLLETTDLPNIPITQFPYVSVVAGLPVPVQHKQGREPGDGDVFLSDLAINVFVFDNVNVDPDSRISFLADELWATLQADKTLSGLVLGKTVSFVEIPTVLRPFVRFRVTVSLQYKHTTGGI